MTQGNSKTIVITGASSGIGKATARSGVLINVSSVGGIMTVPAYGVYNATNSRSRASPKDFGTSLGRSGSK